MTIIVADGAQHDQPPQVNLPERPITVTFAPHMFRYFVIHKPFGMLSQFIKGDKGLRMLGELDFSFPEGTHAIGRLDYTSEGLLLLTTNPAITRLLFNSGIAHPRCYLVNVYKHVSDETIALLSNGIDIRIRGGVDYTTGPAIVKRAERPAGLPRIGHELRADIPQSWLTITLTEGKHRQIRKMLQKAGHPCHRLIRTSIDGLELGDLPAGGVLEMDEVTIFKALNLQQ